MAPPRGTSALETRPVPDTPETAQRFRGATAVVILPTLNEEHGLASTLAQLPLARFADPNFRIEPLVIDGGSTDGTLEVARKWGVPILHQTGRGKGTAVLEAIDWVYRLGVPYVVVLDADATYPPDRILPTLDLLRGDADLVIGVRRPVWGAPRDGRDLIHRLGNMVFSYTASLCTRRTILDLCSGFWGVSTERFHSLEIGSARFAVEAELVLKAIRRGFRVLQIPVDYRERIGVAKLRAVRDGSRILLAIVRFARPSPAPTTRSPETQPWQHQLLSIGVIADAPQAVIRRSLAQTDQADEIAGVLRRALPSAIVRVSAAGLVPAEERDSAPAVDAPAPAEPFVISLPLAGSTDLSASSVTVTLRSQRRQLTIAIEENATPTLPEDTSWARSAAVLARPRADRPIIRFPSLEVLTSRINYDAIAQQRTFLAVNGFRTVEAHKTHPHGSEVPADGA